MHLRPNTYMLVSCRLLVYIDYPKQPLHNKHKWRRHSYIAHCTPCLVRLYPFFLFAYHTDRFFLLLTLSKCVSFKLYTLTLFQKR